jgi:translocation and assembly module TamB
LIRLLRWLVGAALLLAVLGGFLLWLADTGWGHRRITERIAALSPKSGLKIEIGTIDGSIYSMAVLKNVRLSDPAGPFFSAPIATLDWTPTAWWSNRLDVQNLILPTATLHRLPKLRPGDPNSPILPAYDIALGKLDIAQLQIEPGVAGERRLGHVSASLIARKGRALVNLDADAAPGDRVDLKLDAVPDKNRFELAGRLDAPAGGVLGALLGVHEGASALIEGDGNWQNWRGRGQGAYAGKRVADLTLDAQAGRFGLVGNLFLESLTNGKVQRLCAPAVQVRGDARLDDRRLQGQLALLSAALDVRSQGVVDLGRNSFEGLLIETRLLKPTTLFPNMQGRNVDLKVRLNGPFASAGFDYLLTAPQVIFGTTGFDQVRASGQGRLSNAPVRVPIKLTAARVTGVGDVAGGLLTNLTVQGLLQVTPKAISSDELSFVSDKLTGRLALFVDLATGLYDIGVAGQIEQYLIPGLGLVDVKTEFKVAPGLNGVGSRFVGSGQAWVRRFDNPFLASLTGGLPFLETGLVRDPEGVLRLTNLKIHSPMLNLIGTGTRRVDGTFQFTGSGTQWRYGPLKFTLDGRIDRPKLDILLAHPADAMGLANVQLQLDPTVTGYAWRANGRSTLGGFTGLGNLVLPNGGAAEIDITQLQTSGMRASGRLRSVPSGFAGRLALSGGGVDGTLDLSPAGNLQRIEAHLRANDARFEGPPAIAVRKGQFDGVIVLDPGGTTVEGTVLAQGLARGGLTLARLAANVRLRNGVGEIKAALAGSRGRAFDLQTVAQLSKDRWQIIGGGTIDRKPVSLAAPAILTKAASGWRLSPTQVNFAGGRAQVAGLFGTESSEVSAALTQMPLTIMDIFSPGLGLGGIANGTLAYRQVPGSQPTGNADLRIKGLTRAGLVLMSQPIDLGLAANLSGGVAGIRAIAVSGGHEIGRAQARMQPGNSGSLYDRFAAAPLFAQIRYSGSADALWRLSGVETLDVSGPIALGADLSGRVSDPVIRGSLRATNARIESPATGMVLTGVAVSGRFGNGSQLVIDSMSGSTGKDGRVSGSGTVDLSAERGFAINIALNAEQAVLLARDDIGATVTGPVRIVSDGAEGIISGEVTLNRSRFRLGRTQAAQSLPKIKVQEINGRADEAGPSRPAMPWRLALKARAPNRLAVTGLGLDSEWKADLDIGGSPFAPVIRGRADILRGDYEFSGRRFDVSRGTIRFQGENPPDPLLDIVAQGDTQGISATFRVTGSGQRPDISFSSVPSLPEDELLSRLLFGTSITNLSAPEAVQLAAAVASLRDGGNGLNPINAVRNAIGLDRLRIIPADSTTGQRTSVAAGKYLSRRAYVEVVTDGQGYSATRAEFQVMRWLSLLSTISTIGRQSAALRISKDY